MSSAIMMEDQHRIAHWVQQQGKIWTAHNSDDDGLCSSPDLHSHPAAHDLSPSPSPPLSPIGATSPLPPSPQQHSRTPSPRSRTLQRIHTVGSIILPPTSPLRSKISTNHHTLLSVRPAKYRSGSLSPILPFLSPSPDSMLQKTSKHLSTSDRCQSLQKIPSDEDAAFTEHLEADNDLPDCDMSEEFVNYSDLELLASQIGSKLSLVTDLLGLPVSDYEYAMEDIKSPKYQALYVLKKWLDSGDRQIGELCTVLEKADLSHIAKWYRHGILEEQLKRDQDRLMMKRQKLIKKSFPSLSYPKSFDADRTKLGGLSETKLIKHNTLNSIPSAGEFHFLTEEK